MQTADLTAAAPTGDTLRDAYEQALGLADYLRQAIEERPREDVDAAVAAVRADLEPQVARLEDVLAEMRRQIRHLRRQSDAWATLLRLCRDADRQHREDGGAEAGCARVPTDTIRRVLEQTPYPPTEVDPADPR